MIMIVMSTEHRKGFMGSMHNFTTFQVYMSLRQTVRELTLLLYECAGYAEVKVPFEFKTDITR